MVLTFKLMLRGNIVMINLPIYYRNILFNLIDSSAVVLRFTMAVVRISRSVIICWIDRVCFSDRWQQFPVGSNCRAAPFCHP